MPTILCKNGTDVVAVGGNIYLNLINKLLIILDTVFAFRSCVDYAKEHKMD